MLENAPPRTVLSRTEATILSQGSVYIRRRPHSPSFRYSSYPPLCGPGTRRRRRVLSSLFARRPGNRNADDEMGLDEEKTSRVHHHSLPE